MRSPELGALSLVLHRTVWRTRGRFPMHCPTSEWLASALACEMARLAYNLDLEAAKQYVDTMKNRVGVDTY